MPAITKAQVFKVITTIAILLAFAGFAAGQYPSETKSPAKETKVQETGNQSNTPPIDNWERMRQCSAQAEKITKRSGMVEGAHLTSTQTSQF